MSRTRVALVGLVATALVAACSPASSTAPSTTPSTSAPPADPATATVLFTRDSPGGSVPMAGPPDGQGARRLLPDGLYGNPTLVASADGRVLAWTAYTAGPQATTIPTYWVSIAGYGYPVPIPSDQYASATRVAADGRAVYYVVGQSLERYDATNHALTTMCSTCLGTVPSLAIGLGLAVSPDERTVAVSWSSQSHIPGSPISGQATVSDVASSKVLWHVEGKDLDAPVAWTFADDDTLITTVGIGQYAATATIDKVSGFRSSSPTVTATGLVGYGPITYVDGVWWYARDTPGAQVTTTLYVNADLTPEAERKLVDRIDGERSFGYIPVTTAPGPIAVATPSPSSS